MLNQQTVQTGKSRVVVASSGRLLTHWPSDSCLHMPYRDQQDGPTPAITSVRPLHTMAETPLTQMASARTYFTFHQLAPGWAAMISDWRDTPFQLLPETRILTRNPKRWMAGPWVLCSTPVYFHFSDSWSWVPHMLTVKGTHFQHILPA